MCLTSGSFLHCDSCALNSFSSRSSLSCTGKSTSDLSDLSVPWNAIPDFAAFLFTASTGVVIPCMFLPKPLPTSKPIWKTKAEVIRLLELNHCTKYFRFFYNWHWNFCLNNYKKSMKTTVSSSFFAKVISFKNNKKVRKDLTITYQISSVLIYQIARLWLVYCVYSLIWVLFFIVFGTKNVFLIADRSWNWGILMVETYFRLKWKSKSGNGKKRHHTFCISFIPSPLVCFSQPPNSLKRQKVNE